MSTLAISGKVLKLRGQRSINQLTYKGGGVHFDGVAD